MADSVREQILAKIETIITAVSGIGDITRGRMDPLAIQRYPACFISPGPDEYEPLLQDSMLAGADDLNDRRWTISLVLWIKTQATTSAALEAHLAAIDKAMLADITLGGKAYDIRQTFISEPFPMNELDTEAAVVINYSVRYRTRRTDPYTLA